MLTIRLVFGVSTVIMFTLVDLSLGLDGPNICKKEEEFPVKVKVSYPVPYQVKTFGWCWKVPPRCPKTRTAYKVGYREEVQTSKKEIEVCCEGFAEINGRCEPQEIHYHISNTSTLVAARELLIPRGPEGASSSTAGSNTSDTSSAGIWAGIAMTLLLIMAICMFLLVHYKRKLHEVKEELQFVTYTADRPPGLDHMMGENPLYSNSVVVTNASSAKVAAVGAHFVINDLGASSSNKTTNIEKAKGLFHHPMGLSLVSSKVPSQTTEGEFEVPGAYGGCMSSPEVDPVTPVTPRQISNPNIYHSGTPKAVGKSIESGLDKSEPIYEDIESEKFQSSVRSMNSSKSASGASTSNGQLASNDLSLTSLAFYDQPRSLRSVTAIIKDQKAQKSPVSKADAEDDMDLDDSSDDDSADDKTENSSSTQDSNNTRHNHSSNGASASNVYEMDVRMSPGHNNQPSSSSSMSKSYSAHYLNQETNVDNDVQDKKDNVS